jgi:hypothetical protein
MNRSGAPSRLRRAALLFAAALHLLGVAAVPVLHGWFLRDPHPTGWQKQHNEPKVPAHDEQSCAICHAAANRAVAAPAPELPFAESAEAASIPAQAAPLRPSPSRIRLQARAPPASIA